MTLAAGSSNPIVDRAIRAARLDPAVYTEVARDPAATSQALMIVLGVAVLGGIGGLRGGVGPLVISLVFGPLLWVAASWVAHFVGTRFFNVQGVTWIEVARATGFAQVPSALSVLAILPVVGPLVSLAVFVWSLATGVFALRGSLGLEMGPAIITLIVSWVIMGAVIGLIVATLVGLMFGVGAGAGMGMMRF
jgi:hypothetical protein